MICHCIPCSSAFVNRFSDNKRNFRKTVYFFAPLCYNRRRWKGGVKNAYQPLTSIRFLSPCLFWFHIIQGGRVLAFWFMFTDNEMSMMINFAALRFCCGAYFCSPKPKANKCIISCHRTTVKLCLNPVIHSLYWMESRVICNRDGFLTILRIFLMISDVNYQISICNCRFL